MRFKSYSHEWKENLIIDKLNNNNNTTKHILKSKLHVNPNIQPWPHLNLLGTYYHHFIIGIHFLMPSLFLAQSFFRPGSAESFASRRFGYLDSNNENKMTKERKPSLWNQFLFLKDKYCEYAMHSLILSPSH